MVDIGKPYSKLKNYLDGVDLILITHRHGDHLNQSAYNQIKLNHPSIFIATNQETANFISEKHLPQPDLIFNGMEPMYIGNISIYQLDNEHGVECHGFIFEDDEKQLHLFATDLSTTLNYTDWLETNKPNQKLATMLLEANYDPEVIRFIEYKKLHTGFDTFNNGSERHLPVGEWLAMKQNYCNDQTKTEQLHISATYHDFTGCMSKFNFTLNEVKEWKDSL